MAGRVRDAIGRTVSVCPAEGALCDSGGVCFDGICGGAELVDIEDSCAVTRSGAVFCWGENQWSRTGLTVMDSIQCNGQTECVFPPTRVDGLTNIVQISSARNTSACALDAEGAVWCWGANDVGQLGHDPAADTEQCGGAACSSEPQRVEGIPLAAQVSASRHAPAPWQARGSGAGARATRASWERRPPAPRPRSTSRLPTRCSRW